ncbi:MAG TPA: hypothetical protein PLM05_11055 [Bacteroidales bacterium]|nr:hypothetical protein [Lentimicrobiaceae bacterium]HOR10535.1 hypothetical protein [Bacteroidales bacterium]
MFLQIYRKGHEDSITIWGCLFSDAASLKVQKPGVVCSRRGLEFNAREGIRKMVLSLVPAGLSQFSLFYGSAISLTSGMLLKTAVWGGALTMPNVSDKVVRIILICAYYVKRVVWGSEKINFILTCTALGKGQGDRVLLPKK